MTDEQHAALLISLRATNDVIDTMDDLPVLIAAASSDLTPGQALDQGAIVELGYKAVADSIARRGHFAAV